MTDTGARWLITGAVQGVGFRWYVMRHAAHLGLRGWVRNLADGRVEVVAAGEGPEMQRLEALLATGPRSARVERVEKSNIPHDAVDANSFEVR